jgi:DNA-binding protein Fis
LKPGGARTTDLPSLIQSLVRAGIQSVPEDSQRLYDTIVNSVERELIEQVMQMSNEVQVRAAKWLGINRNTLHKKWETYSKSNANGDPPAE